MNLAMDFAAARQNMVDGQIRPNRVTDPRVLAAMRTLPRERFLPPELSAFAYVDEDVRLPGGRALTEPLVIARLVQALALREGERALVIGAGTGYGAALCADCDTQVTALEEDPALLAIARAALPATSPSVHIVEGPLAAGRPGASWDAILIEGTIPDVPEALVDQLALNGRLATVLAAPGECGRATLLRRVGGGVSRVPLFDAATPPLPAFAAAPVFAL